MAPPPPAPEVPPETRAPFTTGQVLRRLARRLDLDERTRLLELGVSGRSAGVLLAADLGCRVTVADASAEALAAVRAEAEAAGVLRQLSLLRIEPGGPALPEEAFELAIAAGRVGALSALCRQLRPALVPSQGRMAAVVAVRVGRASLDVEPWERALGVALRTPQAELAELSRAGFEPEWAEALSEPELVALYGGRPAPPDEEAALVQSGPAGFSFVLVAGRRREQTERPPAARDRG